MSSPKRQSVRFARRTLRSRVGTEKYWPEDRWAQVIQSLRNLQPDHALLLIDLFAWIYGPIV